MFGNYPVSPPGGWGAQKPPRGVGIDRSHPLARGLDLAFPMSEMAGGRCTDVASNAIGTLTGGAKWQATPYGPSISLNNTSETDTQRITLAGWRPQGTSHTFVFQVVSRVSANQRYLMDAQSGRIVVGWNNAYGNVGLYDGDWKSFGSTPTTAAYCHVTVVADGKANVCWSCLNGIQFGTNQTYVPVAIGGEILLGSRYTASGASWFGFQGEMISAWHWNRPLTAAEIMQHHRQPFCMFESGWSMAGPSASRPRIDGSLASGTQLLGAVA